MKNRIYDARVKWGWPANLPVIATCTIPASALGPDGSVAFTYSDQTGFGYRVERPSPPKSK